MIVQSFAQAPCELLACPVERCGRALHQPDVLRWILGILETFHPANPNGYQGLNRHSKSFRQASRKQINLAVATLLIIRQLVLHHQKSNMFYLHSLRNSRPLQGSERWFLSVWTGRQIISCCRCSQRENECRDEEMNEWQQCGKDAEETYKIQQSEAQAPTVQI